MSPQKGVTWGTVRRVSVDERMETFWRIYLALPDHERQVLDDLADYLAEQVKKRCNSVRFSRMMALEALFEAALWKYVKREEGCR